MWVNVNNSFTSEAKIRKSSLVTCDMSVFFSEYSGFRHDLTQLLLKVALKPTTKNIIHSTINIDLVQSG